MGKPLLEGNISYEQHHFMKKLADEIHSDTIELGIAFVDGNEDLCRRLILKINKNSNLLAHHLESLTHKGGYEALQQYLDQLKIQLPGGSAR